MALGEFHVQPAALTSHATHVDAVGDEVGAARQAGRTVGLGADAYGKLCVGVPLLLNLLGGDLIEALGTAEQSLHDSADRLRRTAADYRDGDETAANVIRRAGER
jgi:hypothetical protein